MGELTDEHESVGDVVVAHVDDRGPDPGTDAALRTIQNSMHHARRLWCSLDPVQALTGVTQTVWRIF